MLTTALKIKSLCSFYVVVLHLFCGIAKCLLNCFSPHLGASDLKGKYGGVYFLYSFLSLENQCVLRL